MGLNYKEAGVDIDAGENLVQWLKSQTPDNRPHQERLLGGIGGFAALFRADFPQMQQPYLVSATDGVGTKLKLAIQYQNYAGLGQDLVAMCVNDLLCCGATPLFFLDYYATSRLELDVAKSFLAGLQKACGLAQVALIGGETAEMPGMYASGDFDVAGFSVGVVDRAKILGPDRVRSGDVVLGISSSGFHSNGYSLLRRLFAPDMDQWANKLLTPTHLYTEVVASLQQLRGLKALAHMTGGGMDNLLRVLPPKLGIELKHWPVPAEFVEAKRRAEMSWGQLLRTFNAGVGMSVVIDPSDQQAAMDRIQSAGFSVYELGSLQTAETQSWRLSQDWVE